MIFYATRISDQSKNIKKDHPICVLPRKKNYLSVSFYPDRAQDGLFFKAQ